MNRQVIATLLALSIFACGDAGNASSDGSASSGGTTGTATTVVMPTSTEAPTTDATTDSSSCVGPADCPVDVPACRSSECIAGECVYTDVSDGTLLSDQVSGDCAVVVCEAGGRVTLADMADVEDDGVLCTLDACDGTTPTHTPGMTSCYTGEPATASVGACVAGVQQCDDAGAPVGPCVGEVLPGLEDCDRGLADEDCDGAVNEDGPACVCVPGEPAPCYAGPDGTQDVGLCQAGSGECGPDGLGTDACAGEVTPSDEDCEPGGLDEDCDGEVNESGRACVCGDGFVSNDEACDDGNTESNDACSDDCTEALEVVEVSLGIHHGCARFNNGRIKCWGVNSGGRLGLGDQLHRGDEPGEMGAALPYVDLGTGVKVAQLAMGSGDSCARLTDGRVKCWGNNSDGSLGLGDSVSRGGAPGDMGDNLPFVALGTNKKAIDLQGRHVRCALLDDGHVKCWGWGEYGTLGTGNKQSLGDTPNETGDGLPVVDIGDGTTLDLWGGSLHMCARQSGGSIKCWGSNINGELGLGDTMFRGDNPNEMGVKLPAVDLGPGSPADLSLGIDHGCARYDDGTLRCWGYGLATGQGDALAHIGDAPGEMGMNLPAVDVAGSVVEVLSNRRLTCVRLVDGATKCFGTAESGALGNGSLEDIGDQPGEMGVALPTVDLGTGRTAVRLFGGTRRTCAILDDKTLKCWGNNSLGQLGVGDNNDRGDEPGEMGDALPVIQLF